VRAWVWAKMARHHHPVALTLTLGGDHAASRATTDACAQKSIRPRLKALRPPRRRVAEPWQRPAVVRGAQSTLATITLVMLTGCIVLSVPVNAIKTFGSAQTSGLPGIAIDR
jgi:hypothetical protein